MSTMALFRNEQEAAIVSNYQGIALQMFLMLIVHIRIAPLWTLEEAAAAKVGCRRHG